LHALWSPEILRVLPDGTLTESTGMQSSSQDSDETFARETCRILIVEDDPRLRAVVSAFLQDEGFRVETAGDGVEALACIERNRPRAVVLDMHLPLMNGWELADEIRARGIKVPILVMTAAQDARKWAEQIGASEYVAKPVSLPTLLKRIDDLCA